MAVFFNHRVQSPKSDSSPHLLEWHPTQALLAVASKDEATDANGILHIHLDQVSRPLQMCCARCTHTFLLCTKGEVLEGASIQRSVPVECMQWHPVKVILAIGWRSGEITVYNESNHELFQRSSLHKKPIAFVVWNSTGSRLISGDKVKTCIMQHCGV